MTSALGSLNIFRDVCGHHSVLAVCLILYIPSCVHQEKEGLLGSALLRATPALLSFI